MEGIIAEEHNEEDIDSIQPMNNSTISIQSTTEFFGPLLVEGMHADYEGMTRCVELDEEGHNVDDDSWLTCEGQKTYSPTRPKQHQDISNHHPLRNNNRFAALEETNDEEEVEKEEKQNQHARAQ